MEVTRDLRSFLARPSGKALVAPQHVIWSSGSRCGGTIVWGDCGVREAESITSAWDYEAHFEAPYDAVVDMSGITHIEARGFLVVERDMRRRLPALARRIRRQAIVRPRGMAGAIVAGFYPMLAPSFDWRVFDGREEAYAWACGAEGGALLSELDAIVAPEREPAEDLSRVREAVRASLEETLTLEAIARRVGRSARSLQRSLTQAGTTFRAETSRLRMERAREMLEQSELKIESIARAVGLRSASSFASTFRAVTGTTPSEYRRTRERTTSDG